MTCVEELDKLLDSCRPLSALALVGEDAAPEILLRKAQALRYTDRTDEALQCVEPLIERLQGEDRSEAFRTRCNLLGEKMRIDEAILSARAAVECAPAPLPKATALMALAHCYASKGCFQLAQETIREGKALVGPDASTVLVAEAGIQLESDQRLEARDLYDRLAASSAPWAKFYALQGKSGVAFILGDFEEACRLAEQSVALSDEMVFPYYALAQLSLIDEDADRLQVVIDRIERRFSCTDRLPRFKTALESLRKRKSSRAERHQRLKAFPTTMQKRNYCGPSTMDLVLRFWKASEQLTDDQIAAYVKLPHSGTPPHRMREFFSLVGFDTIRCLASIENLKRLIDAGFPVIVDASSAESAHVTVVIGYDESEKIIELQDPMTHILLPLPEASILKFRKLHENSALIAFPHGQGHDKRLAELGFFDEPSVVWTDQAGVAMEKGQHAEVASLMERAVKRLPEHQISWLVLLGTRLELWRTAQQGIPAGRRRISLTRWRRARQAAPRRKQFYDALADAKKLFPDSPRVVEFEARGAQLDGRWQDALEAFQRATAAEEASSQGFAGLAEIYFGLRQPEKALEAAREALKRNPSSGLADVWMARCLTATGKDEAELYARCGLELLPGWPTAHLAMAEVWLRKNDPAAARKEIDIGLGLEPTNTELQMLRMQVPYGQVQDGSPVEQCRDVLRAPTALTLRVRYDASQRLCRELFSARKFGQAEREAKRLLRYLPEDVWALQFRAAARAEATIQRRRHGPEAGRPVRQLYVVPIELSKADASIVGDYLGYLGRIEGHPSSLAEINRLREAYPDNAVLWTLHAQALRHTNQPKEAAQAMLQALGTPNAVVGPDVLNQAVQIILAGCGAEEGEAAILAIPDVEGVPKLSERRLAVGLAYADGKPETKARARPFLEEAVQSNPEDVRALVALGDITEDHDGREELYHRALRASPGSEMVRATLANFLVDQGRADEALQFAAGRQDESPRLMYAQYQALCGLGRYDEAAAILRYGLARIENATSGIFTELWQVERLSGDHAAALRVTRRALRAYPTEQWRRLQASYSLRHMGRWWQAGRELEAAQMAGVDYGSLLWGRYEQARDEGRLEAALRIVEMQCRQQPKEHGKQLTDVEQNKLWLLLELKREEQAKLLVTLHEPETAAEWAAVLQICLAAEAWQLAEEYASRALALDAEEPTALLAQAAAQLETGRVAEGEKNLESLRLAYPRRCDSYGMLALLRAVDGRLDEALELAERAVLIGEYSYGTWATRGYVYFLRREWDLARADLERAWRRADLSQRRKTLWVWWLLGAMQNRPIVAWLRRRRAWKEAHVEWHERMFRGIDEHLRRTATERLRQSAWIVKPREWMHGLRRALARGWNAALSALPGR